MKQFKMLSRHSSVSSAIGLQTRAKAILLESWEEQWGRFHRKVAFKLDLDFEQFFKAAGKKVPQAGQVWSL